MSSTVYLGFPAVQSRNKRIEVSAALKEKGIEMLRAPPSQVTVIARPLVASSLWNIFIGHLSAVLFTLAMKASVSLHLAGYWITVRHPRSLPVSFPDLSITVKNLNQATTDWLMEHGFEEQRIRDEAHWLLNEPDSIVLQQLASDKCPVRYNSTSFAPVGYANMSAMNDFSIILNILSFCAQALQSPVFDKEFDPTEFVNINDVDEDEEMAGDSEAARPVVKENSPKGFAQRSRLAKFFDIDDATSTPRGSDMCVGRIPDSIKTCYSIDDFTGATTLSGMLIRFVPDLTEEDQTGVPSFISKYLFRSLGTDFSEQVTNFNDLKSSWGVLRNTGPGHILSHMVKCMEIAINAQCGIKFIFDYGSYEGGILQGNGYSLFTQDVVMIPSTPGDLYEDICALETHKKMQDEIYEILRAGGIDDGAFPGNIESMYSLRTLCLLGTFSETQRTELMNKAGKLRFTLRKWAVNQGSILKFLTIIKDGDGEYLSDNPLGPESLFTKDWIEIAMSCFPNTRCPSFRHSSGTAINLRAKKAPAPATSEGKSKKQRGPAQINNGGWVFTIRRIKFEEAVVDFHTLLREGEARSMGSASAKNLGCFILSGGTFEKVFYTLQECVNRFSEGLGGNPELKNTDIAGNKRVASQTLLPDGMPKKTKQNFF